MNIHALQNKRKKPIHFRLDPLLIDMLNEESIKTRVAKSNLVAEIVANHYNIELADDYCVKLTKKQEEHMDEINKEIQKIDEMIDKLKKQRLELLK